MLLNADSGSVSSAGQALGHGRERDRGKDKGKGKSKGKGKGKNGTVDSRPSWLLANLEEKTRGKTRSASASASASASKWRHPEGLPLEAVEEGKIYPGRITNLGVFGVFVDIGAVKDGLLRLPSHLTQRHGKPHPQGLGLRRGQDLEVLVVSCDPDAERLLLELDGAPLEELQAAGQGATPDGQADADDAMDADAMAVPSQEHRRGQGGSRNQSIRPQRAQPPAGRPTGAGGAGGAVRLQRERSSVGRDPERQRVPLEELQSGSTVRGVVGNVNAFGVFLDIGAASDAKLRGTREIRKHYCRGDVIEGLHVDWVDAERRRVQVSIPHECTGLSQGEGEGRHNQPRPRPRPRTQHPQPSPQPLPSHQHGSRPPQRLHGNGDARRPLESFPIGSVVDGVVCGTGPRGILVDIGCAKSAKLRVPRELVSQIQEGDEVVGMQVDAVDLYQGSITVSIDDPELAITEDHGGGLPPSETKAARAGPKTKGKPKRDQRQRTSVGDFLDGTVVRAGPSGIFVDVGNGVEARLVVAPSFLQEFQRGDRVYGMRVERIGPRMGELLLSIEEPHLDVPSRSPAAPLLSAAKQRPQWDNSGVAAPLPLESLRVGELVTGIVTTVGPVGVFLDIGAVEEGHMQVPREDAKKLKTGDIMEGLRVEAVSLRRKEVSLALTYRLGDVPYETEVETETQPHAQVRAGRPAMHRGRGRAAAAPAALGGGKRP